MESMAKDLEPDASRQNVEPVAASGSLLSQRCACVTPSGGCGCAKASRWARSAWWR